MSESFEHNGHTVTLTRDYRFQVSGPAFEGENQPVFDAAGSARDSIDRRAKLLAAQNRHKAVTALEAIAENGERCTIRGIHMNTRELLGVPKTKGSFRDSTMAVYPPEPWVAADLAEIRRLKNELAKLQSRLRPYRMEGKLSGYEQLTAETYDARLTSFIEVWRRLCEAAKAAAPKGE